MEKKIKDELEKYVFEDTRTIDLLDQFEGIGEKNNTIYKRIVLKNNIYLDGHTLHLVIERGKKRDYVGDVTFTEFKKSSNWKLKEHIKKEINLCDNLDKYYGRKEIFYFEEPYHLRAQNSLNRSGYGWEWDWTDGGVSYTEGTLYGETTDYIFVGVYID